MLYGKTVGYSDYKVLVMMDLPEEIYVEIECIGNGTAQIVNPEYHPKLKQWLKDNGHSDTDCYIGWWSW
jgi:hypothetical protein